MLSGLLQALYNQRAAFFCSNISTRVWTFRRFKTFQTLTMSSFVPPRVQNRKNNIRWFSFLALGIYIIYISKSTRLLSMAVSLPPSALSQVPRLPCSLLSGLEHISASSNTSKSVLNLFKYPKARCWTPCPPLPASLQKNTKNGGMFFLISTLLSSSWISKSYVLRPMFCFWAPSAQNREDKIDVWFFSGPGHLSVCLYILKIILNFVKYLKEKWERMMSAFLTSGCPKWQKMLEMVSWLLLGLYQLRDTDLSAQISQNPSKPY
jgi:hypothetical protein